MIYRCLYTTSIKVLISRWNVFIAEALKLLSIKLSQHIAAQPAGATILPSLVLVIANVQQLAPRSFCTNGKVTQIQSSNVHDRPGSSLQAPKTVDINGTRTFDNRSRSVSTTACNVRELAPHMQSSVDHLAVMAHVWPDLICSLVDTLSVRGTSSFEIHSKNHPGFVAEVGFIARGIFHSFISKRDTWQC